MRYSQQLEPKIWGINAVKKAFGHLILFLWLCTVVKLRYTMNCMLSTIKADLSPL